MKKQFAVSAVVAFVAASFSVAVTATPAMAATVTVTTTADVVNGADGVVSLREAVNQANAAGDATVIELAASTTYSLTSCGGGSDDGPDGTG